ncbi:centromeric protein E [Vigna unguiculata]|uniref:Kinesin-like protein n=1 Tax=Vigna unguiculata TaxID=3917 RepID=A0A4D6L0S1_VIGUN|nr:centromeric protein E [Vigna unguiculata]
MGSIAEEAMQGSAGSEERILVSVRVRPLNEKEFLRNDLSEWECINHTTIMYRSNLSATERSLYPTAYTFDRVFSIDSDTRQVYEEAAKEVALSVLSGINSSIFAYGQTSSGKTYTMSGITEYAVADIFNYIEQHMERDFVLKFSALEIYNESVRDLLSVDSTPLRLLDDPEKGTVVERLTEETVRNWNHFQELIFFCEAQRQIGETALNEVSSRSHQILRLTVESSASEFMGNTNSFAASVNFVDLAGSERASQTNSAGTRLKEGCHINRSLLTLGTVIRKLSKGRNGHIPFRDSKLTRILQSSLAGNAKTAIICTMSPARSHVEQTRNTLLFASCAKEVTTNARVNVVMSDKLLVKQLQKELARLESELKILRPTKPDSSALLKEKDLLIEMLKREVMDLRMQRDLANSQIKDMLQVVGDDTSSSELDSLGHQYPKLRVRSSFDFENRTTEPPNSLSFDCIESIRSFDASQYSDGHSNSSDENYFQLPDLEKSLPVRISSPVLSVESLDDAENDLDQKSVEEQHQDNLEEGCREVTCIGSEDTITNTRKHSNSADRSKILYTESVASSPTVSGLTEVGLTEVDNRDKEKPDLWSAGLKDNKEINSLEERFVVPSSEKISRSLTQSGASSSKTVKLTRSRSCKETLMRDTSSDWFDQEEMIQNTTPIGTEKDFTRAPEDPQKKTSTPNYNANSERLSWDDHENSQESTADIQNTKTYIDNESCDDNSLPPGKKEKDDLESSNLQANPEVPANELQSDNTPKKFKDVGSNPLQSEEEKQVEWSSEFKRLQKQIIGLWDACHVSLVHRTYFFLLFKGDPSDSIYMEVELRRLFYLKQTFAKGNQTVEDGYILNADTSHRYLRAERQMLSKQMEKKLSKSERENLYIKWGVSLSSKYRRLQLSHRLWSKTDDMDHIRESATIVAKLVGSVEPDQAFKEMFGLNFAPRTPKRRSFGWTTSMKNIL